MSALDPAMSVGGLAQLHGTARECYVRDKCPAKYFATNVSFLLTVFLLFDL